MPKSRQPTVSKSSKVQGVATDLDLRSLADFVPAMIGLYNVLTNEYIFVNKAVKKLLGYTQKEFLEGGLPFAASLVHPEDAPRIAKQNQQAITKIQKARRKNTKPAPIVSFEYRMQHKKGHYVWLQTDGSIYSWTDDGKIEHLINVSIDISERKQKEVELREITNSLEERIKERTERLELALDAAQMGIWEHDLKTGTFNWSPRAKKLFGLKPDDTITPKKFINLIHPDDRHILMNASQNSKPGELLEHRVIWPDGSVHWLLTQGKLVKENGVPTRIAGIAMNVDKLKQSQETTTLLRQQQAELLELTKAKDEFISLASHQLRTPATGVKQYLGILLEGYIGGLTNDQLHMLQVAYESNERQLTIIDDLLRVAHVDAGQIAVHKTKVDLVRLVEDVLREQLTAHKQRQQKTKLKTSHAKITGHVDPDKFRMVLENLVDNASKYTPVGKTFSIELSKQKTGVVIRVTDQGVGIAKKDQNKLFQKFSRIENPLSTLVGGSGLGLYWVKKIIDLHDGTIEVNSRLHRGTSFIITIPGPTRK